MSSDCRKDQYSKMLTLQMPEQNTHEKEAVHLRVPLNSSSRLICEGLGQSLMTPSKWHADGHWPTSRLTETVFVPTSWSFSFGFREQMLVEA
jgi:hypothetical protein